MALLDRAGFVARMGDNHFSRKVGNPIVVARRPESTSPTHNSNYGFDHGMVVPGSSYWPIASRPQPRDVGADAEGLKTVTDLADNMVWLLQKLG